MDPAIELNDIHCSFQKHFWQRPQKALRGISLVTMKGEVFGLVGQNGAGKTTIIKIITGLLRPESGQVRIFGMDVHERAVKKRIGFLPETPYFYKHLTGYEFLRLHEHLSGQRNDRVYAYELLTRMGLKESTDVPLDNYSRDMLQRIGYAQACISDPDLLILDQPFDGLDPLHRREMKQHMLDAKKKGKTIFLTSCILPDIAGLCDRVGIIQDGLLIKTGDPGALLDKKINPDEITMEQWVRSITKRS
ncbi:ABC transporter ATP-binding protein [candidate division WOR-3 bacterium]|nr:ABC transporter ATP-binding protein [candidate division WOR-3 bacterium]